MWSWGLQDRNRTTLVHRPLVAGRYSVALTCWPLTMDSYSAGWSDNPMPHNTCTRRGETTGCDGLHTIEVIIRYTR
jgi:hypothetical protein